MADAPQPWLAAALEAVEEAVLVLDGAMRCCFANAAGRRWLLLPEQPLAAPRTVDQLYRTPELLHGVEGVLASKAPWTRRMQLADGTVREVRVAPLAVDPGGDGCIVVARDISGAARLETLRRDFVAGLAHELRTPLTSIQGYVELLQEEPGEASAAERREYLQAVARNAARLGRLTRDLLLLAAVETGEYPFRMEAVEAAEAARAVLADLAPLAARHGAVLDGSALRPGWVHADREALHRILLNLLENAILHGRRAGAAPGTQRVELAGAPEGASYVLRVRDNGPGIGSRDQPRVFERFYRVAAGRSGGGHGTGLGLALVKHLAEMQGGAVWVESALGQGSTFLLQLRAGAAEEESP